MIFEDRFIWEVIIGLGLLAIIFLSIILYTRLNFVLDRKWTNDIRNLYETLLAHYVNARDQGEALKIKKRIIKISNTPRKKQILLNVVIDLHDNFNGQCSRLAKEIYTELKLHRLSIAKLHSRKWHRKIEGIVELSLMGFRKAYDLIIPLLFHSSRPVRRAAKIALVELKKSKGLEDISKVPTEMSEWTYLSILSILHRSPVKLTEEELDQLKMSRSDSMKSLAAHLEKHSLVY